MLNLNKINKVRKVLKALYGLQTSFIPSLPQWNPNTGHMEFSDPFLTLLLSGLKGNPFMKSNGIPSVGNTLQFPSTANTPLLLPKSFMDTLDITLKPKTFEGNIPQDETSPLTKTWLRARNYIKQNPSTIGLGIDFVDKTFFLDSYDGKYGSFVLGTDQTYDAVKNVVGMIPGYGTILQGAMLVGGFATDLFRKLGMKTDNTNVLDATLGNKFLALTPLGIGNVIGASRTDKLNYDKEVMARMAPGYTGSQHKLNRAEEFSDKKVGLFPTISGKKGEFNNTIREAGSEADAIAMIDKENRDREAMVTGASDLNYIRYKNKINDTFDPRYAFHTKFGGKLRRVKQINFHKTGGEIKGVIDLNKEEWIPEIIEPIELFKEGGNIEWEPEILLEGGKAEWNFDTWFNSIPEQYRANKYDYKLAFEVFSEEDLRKHANDPKNNHLRSVSNKLDDKGRYPFLKLGKLEDNSELLGEFDWYNKKSPEKYSLEDLDFINNHTIEYDGDRYYYVPKKLKEGGKAVNFKDAPLYKEYEKGWPNYSKEKTSKTENLKNVIPEGALHARKHNMENAEELTKKGIPVVDNNNELQAEIEREEIILTLELTKKMEELYNKYNSESVSQKDKDLIAIEAGEILVREILFNTDDRTLLIARTEV